MRGNEGLHNKCNKVSLNRGGSHIDSLLLIGQKTKKPQ